MRQLLRILLNAATVLSLVLCAVTMAAWVRSYQAQDTVFWTMTNPPLTVQAYTYRGGVFAGFAKPVGTGDEWYLPGAGWVRGRAWSFTELGGAQGTLFNRFGFALPYDHNGAVESRTLACPFWFLVLLTAILPAVRLARRRARRLRMGAGLCQHCGYDCRATLERCPECGTAR